MCGSIPLSFSSGVNMLWAYGTGPSLRFKWKGSKVMAGNSSCHRKLWTRDILWGRQWHLHRISFWYRSSSILGWACFLPSWCWQAERHKKWLHRWGRTKKFSRWSVSPLQRTWNLYCYIYLFIYFVFFRHTAWLQIDNVYVHVIGHDFRSRAWGVPSWQVAVPMEVPVRFTLVLSVSSVVCNPSSLFH